jgi:hypothetical protein
VAGTPLGSDDPPGSVVVGPNNLIDVDPLFADAAGGDVSLLDGSLAIDAGDATVSPSPKFDLHHAPRVVGLDADAGAFERDGLFGDGFESRDGARLLLGETIDERHLWRAGWIEVSVEASRLVDVDGNQIRGADVGARQAFDRTRRYEAHADGGRYRCSITIP